MTMNKRFPATCQDRESAVGLLGRLARLDPSYAHFDDIALRISEGGHDDAIWVQVFAAHRLAVLAEASRKIEERRDAFKRTKAPGWQEVVHESNQCLAVLIP